MVHAKKKRSAACAKKIIFCLGLELEVRPGAACKKEMALIAREAK
jgi:hypothetical protein